MTPVSKLVQGELVVPSCAGGWGGAGARLGGAMLCFGGWLEQHRRGAHGRLMQLLSNSQTRIRGERGRRWGGCGLQPPALPWESLLFAGVPQLTLPAPAPRHAPGWQQGLQGAPRAGKVAETAGLVGEHPKWGGGGQMLL